MKLTGSSCGCSIRPCGCCDGVAILTPNHPANRAGLPAIGYRAGTHGQFLATMKARLSAMEVDETGPDGRPLVPPRRIRPLAALTARDTSDFSIALLDGWATLGDVLCFYQERIANEGFIRTATERRSVLELARLVGYNLRPGVAASVHLAYGVDQNQADPVTIPAGSRAQSLPGPGEAPQSFETSEDLHVRREWNDLAPRRSRPQKITLATILAIDRVYLIGRSTNLKAGDPLLFVFNHLRQRGAVRTVIATEDGPDPDMTIVRLAPAPLALAVTMPLLLLMVNEAADLREKDQAGDRSAIEWGDEALRAALMDQTGDPGTWITEMDNAADIVSPELRSRLDRLNEQIAAALEAIEDAPDRVHSDPAKFVEELLAPRIPQVASSAHLRRSLARVFRPGADAAPQLLINFAPELRDSYYAAWSGTAVATASSALVGIFALRVSAAPFGAGATRQPSINSDAEFTPASEWPEWPLATDEARDAVWLDQAYPAVVAPSYAVIHRVNGRGRQVYGVTKAEIAQRTAYGLSGKSSRVSLDRDWWALQNMEVLRSTLVYAASEPLILAAEPIVDDVGGNQVELGGLYQELSSGRFVILTGERADIPGVTGVVASELMVLSNVVHGYDAQRAGDTTHTTLHFATSTAYRYRRDKLVIHGNVVRATHGETRSELLGSGDGAAALQSFTLKQPPLTFTSAPTAAGAETTLAVYVDDVAWHETSSLAWLGPKDRGFVTATGDDDKTTIVFGDGLKGARLPSGVQNVRAVYRSGIGAPGNVRAGQISLVQTRPLGVSAVINPLRASGGANRETRDLARENAPLSVATLDRIVSVQDYSDFTRRFAGIAKAVAVPTTDGRRRLIYLTIAGVDDAPIDATSDLYRNLGAALRDLGDPAMPVVIVSRELKALTLSAGIRVAKDHLWDPVSAAVRAALLDRFGFARRALGQPARLAQIVAAIQSVPGVTYVDVDAFGAIPEKVSDNGRRRLVRQDEIAEFVRLAVDRGGVQTAGVAPYLAIPDVMAWPGGFDRGSLRPAELAIFTPAVPDTLILNEIL